MKIRQKYTLILSNIRELNRVSNTEYLPLYARLIVYATQYLIYPKSYI